MKARHFVPFLCTALCAAPAFAQRGPDGLRVIDPSTLRVIPSKAARDTVRAATPQVDGQITPFVGALPVFNYTVTAAQDGKTYSGSIVGQNPTSGASTTVPTVIVPVVLRITQGGTTFVFDPTQPDAGCLGGTNTALSLEQNSPLFNSAPFTLNGVNVGTTQWPDANARGEFWNELPAGSGYHVLLSTTTGPTLTITINARNAGTTTAEVFSLSGTQCGNTTATTNPGAKIAVVNINTIDAQLQNYIKAHGLTTGQFPFFVTYNAVISNGAANNLNNCCILGYHNALSNGQTYGIGEFEGRNGTVFTGVADVAAPSHEVNEWVNDPFGNNPTPAWGNVGQVSGCQGNLEDGDPLSGTLMPTVALNGFTYHLQELAGFSWFYGGTSLGTGGKFSSNGTFTIPAALCPPGGP
jgi:hypothetical protein